MKNNITNMEVKKTNRNRIFRYICKHCETSNPDIAYALKISLPTVTQNTKELIERGLIEEVGELQSTGGRRAKALSVCADSKLAIGLNISKNHIALVLINLTGKIIKYDRTYMPYRKDENYFFEVNQKLECFLASCNVERSRILGIGIALPGICNLQKEELTHSNILNENSLPFKKINQYFQFPCSFLNEANAGAYAEGIQADAPDRFFYLSLSHTVGGAIFSKKELIQGNHFQCGEVGHMTIVPDGVLCHCGKKGCMNAYCSAQILSEAAGGRLELFFKGLAQKDEKIVKIWDTYTTYLSIAINNIYMMLDCDIILGGYVGSFVEDHLPDITRKVSERTISAFGKCDFVKPCTFKNEAAALGAASQVIEQFVESI